MSRRVAALLLLGCLASAPAFAGVWSNLWRTPDQQGEALLAAGHPARAAARFTSAGRKAYADLLAGRYARAARLLAPLKDPTSEYNRGNALAHLGRLHAALAAYNAALKLEPHDRDIRHNRDLVERMLAHHRPQHPKSQHGGAGSKSAPGGHSGGHNGHGGHNGSAQNKQHQPGAQRAPGTAQTRSTGAAGSQQARGQTHHAGATRGEHAGAQPHATASTPSSAPGGHTHDAGQTLRNAERAAEITRRQARQGQGRAAASGARRGPQRAARPLLPRRGEPPQAPLKPPSEKALALKQWLRQIPNDPAGLLRRKFLIEYLLRHPGAHP